ncbi:hypothetical protein HJG60_011426 [Phyllostomus discolor]|uniref:Uncharacterized protein n=1 Tax=Phyllostomus discolor TaxID=89673 RepID=A0A834A4Q1_9CHIR|nr:hypothetical protein HJG60_011426 [Phyllostomus discolor]
MSSRYSHRLCPPSRHPRRHLHSQKGPAPGCLPTLSATGWPRGCWEPKARPSPPGQFRGPSVLPSAALGSSMGQVSLQRTDGPGSPEQGTVSVPDTTKASPGLAHQFSHRLFSVETSGLRRKQLPCEEEVPPSARGCGPKRWGRGLVQRPFALTFTFETQLMCLPVLAQLKGSLPLFPPHLPTVPFLPAFASRSASPPFPLQLRHP